MNILYIYIYIYIYIYLLNLHFYLSAVYSSMFLYIPLSLSGIPLWVLYPSISSAGPCGAGRWFMSGKNGRGAGEGVAALPVGGGWRIYFILMLFCVQRRY